ncbi:MAG: hypothetical protein LBP37_00845 [Spirochaetaceae bacterium]|nr:hypothetical protein [Spirochaetaceae bacterium]
MCAVFFVSCENSSLGGKIKEFIEQPPYKTITVSDSDPAWPARISDINNKVILLMLSSQEPKVSEINDTLFKTSVYTIGKVTRNKISLKLYHNKIEYWTGNGNYWVVFVLPDGRAEHISWMYVSRQPHDFYDENTYLTNIDFMPAVNINIDTTDMLPF